MRLMKTKAVTSEPCSIVLNSKRFAVSCLAKKVVVRTKRKASAFMVYARDFLVALLGVIRQRGNGPVFLWRNQLLSSDIYHIFLMVVLFGSSIIQDSGFRSLSERRCRRRNLDGMINLECNSPSAECTHMSAEVVSLEPLSGARVQP